jgi:hypothetical protein
MKKVLLITYHFPPRPTIGGLRLSALAKYLPANGWDVFVLTPKYNSESLDALSNQFKVIRTPSKDVSINIAKILNLNDGVRVREHIKTKLGVNESNNGSLLSYLVKLSEEIIAYPDPQRGWYKYGVQAGSEILKNENIDVIVSSSKPETCHLIAKSLHDKFKIPWVADFRDLWTQNHYYSNSLLRTLFEKRLELKTIGSADALVTVSKPLSEKMKVFHKTKKVYVVTNGYDPNEVGSSNVTLTTKFTITYTGTYYEGKRDPTILFKAIVELISESVINPKDVEIRFFGPKESWLQKQIEFYNLQEVVFQYGIVQREIALTKQKESQLLLLLLWNHPSEIGVYTGKIFEYLSSCRPIIANTCSKSVIGELLDETNAGKYAESVEKMKNIILQYYKEFKSRGFISYEGNLQQIKKYSQYELAEKYSCILNKLI